MAGMNPAFFVVDVFAQQPYCGNQLAVVMGAQALPDEQMQKIAAEINFSETTFVSPSPEPDGSYRVRIFTPAREIAFAGHPILGTAWVIREYAGQGRGSALRLKLAVGEIAVNFEVDAGGGETVWFTAPPSTLGATHAAGSIALALGIAVQDIDTASPVQTVSAGVSALIVPLRSQQALSRHTMDAAAFARLSAQGLPSLVYLYCREPRSAANDLCARFFFEAHGPREDPATGNGAAFLGAYLLEHGIFAATGFSLRIEQGHEVRRPSLVLLRARRDGGKTVVSVGGSVVPVVRGELAQA